MAQITLNSSGVASSGSLVLQSNGTTTAVTIDSSQCAAFVAGTAAAPAITTSGDTNTGLFFPAADTVGITTGGTERARVDSSGNLGLGVTPSAWSGSTAFQMNALAISNASANYAQIAHNAYVGSGGWTYKGTGLAMRHQIGQDGYQWHYAASGTAGNAITWTQAMTLDASGNLGIGATIPANYGKLAVVGTVAPVSPDLSLQGLFSAANTGEIRVGGYKSGGGTYLVFSTGADAERARIDSSGNLLVGTTSSTDTSGVGIKNVYSSTVPYITVTTDTTNGGDGCYHLYNLNATNNGYRFYVRSNGGISNYSGNNVNLSDERTKTNIEVSGGYLDKICAIPVKLFNYKDEAEGEQRTLGVIAQDVEAVAPELVDQDGWLGEAPEGEAPLKSIYTTDMMFALMKCIQELKAELDAAKARITALEA